MFAKISFRLDILCRRKCTRYETKFDSFPFSLLRVRQRSVIRVYIHIIRVHARARVRAHTLINHETTKLVKKTTLGKLVNFLISSYVVYRGEHVIDLILNHIII